MELGVVRKDCTERHTPQSTSHGRVRNFVVEIQGKAHAEKGGERGERKGKNLQRCLPSVSVAGDRS